ncbi:MAG: AmmeMemoRadiSam system protein B [Actinomycetota bacterium]
MTERIRHPVAAGSFYPSDARVLEKEIRGYLDNAENHRLEGIKALIAPHAGYMYSGQVAAHAYRQVEGKSYDSVVVIAPSHSDLFDFVSIYPGDYETPLGRAKTDQENAELLVSGSDNIRISSQGHSNEHSLEVQIPFLQAVLGQVKIIPMVIGNQSPDLVNELGSMLGKTFQKKDVLIIASTDLSHYHPYNIALSLDQQVEELIADFNIQGLADRFFGQDVEMCGGGPVVSAMIAARSLGSKNSKVLVYKNSGDVIGDRSAVVGYLSAVLY